MDFVIVLYTYLFDPPDSSSPEERVKSEGASRGYEFSSEESEGEENNREVKDDPLDSSSPEGRVKCEGENLTDWWGRVQ
jgi:hypothetical protein